VGDVEPVIGLFVDDDEPATVAPARENRDSPTDSNPNTPRRLLRSVNDPFDAPVDDDDDDDDDGDDDGPIDKSFLIFLNYQHRITESQSFRDQPADNALVPGFYLAS
jgi:hypothetical protein